MSGDASTPEQDQTVESGAVPATPESASDAPEATLSALKQEHETLNSQYMRIAADFDNFRKRQSRDQDDMRQQLVCSTLTEILPVVDNFERARQQLNPEGEEAVQATGGGAEAAGGGPDGSGWPGVRPQPA